MITVKTYRGWLTPEGLHNCVVRNEHLSSEDLVRLCDQGRRFYLRPRYIVYNLRQVASNPKELFRTAKAARVFFRYLLHGSNIHVSDDGRDATDRERSL